MQNVLDFFQWLGDLIGIVIEFIVNFFQSLITFISLLPSIVTFTFSAIANLPPSISVFATVTVTVAITLLLLGRSNNS